MRAAVSVMGALVAGLVSVSCSAATESSQRADVLASFSTGADALDVGESLDIREIHPTSWDRLGMFPAYAANDDVRRVLSVSFDIEAASPWANTEGGTMVLFATGDHVDSWIAVPDDVTYFGCIGGGLELAADAATLQMVQGESGELVLAPRSSLPCIDNIHGTLRP
jgi:hypothetical protein